MRKGPSHWRNPKREEIAWAAGLFEGEGTVGAIRRPMPRPDRALHAALHMIDEESVREFGSIIGVGKVTGPIPRPHQPAHLWRASNFEHVQHVVAVLWPWLSPRRKQQARRALEATRELAPRYRNGLAYRMFGKQAAALDKEQHKAYNQEHWRRRKLGIGDRAP